MVRLANVVLFVLLGALLVFGQQGESVVEGTVRDAATRAGVGGVSVYLQLMRAAASAGGSKAETDGLGRFRIAGLKPGSYRIHYQRDGYLDFDRADAFAVGAEAVKLEDELAPWARLSGRVFDADGKPAAGIQVDLLPLPIYGGTEDGEDPVTDGEGRFTFNKLAPGSYQIRARPKAKVAAAANKSAEDRVEVVTTYFPSVVDRAIADNVVVRPGSVMSGLDVHVQTAPIHAVRGVVLDADGMPASGVNVSMTSETGSFGRTLQMGDREKWIRPGRTGAPGETQRVTTDARGQFEFLSVLAGDWQLTADPPAAKPEMGDFGLLHGGEAIRVGRRDLEGVEIRLFPRFTLQVEMDWNGEPPGSELIGLVSAEPESGAMSPVAELKAKGITQLHGMSQGRYRLVVMLAPRTRYVASIEVGGRDVMREPILLTAGLPPVRIVVRSNPGRLLGSVEKGGGSKVLVWPDGAIESDFARVLQADANGSFQLDSLRPGAYRAIAVDRVDNQVAMETFLRLAPSAKLVRVDEGTTTSVRLDVTRWQ